MAPARNKRGAKGAKTKSALSLGDLVLAKVKGFPAWPAKISRPEDWKRAPDPKKYFVQFFGTQEIAFVAPVDIQAFTSETKNKLLARCQGKTVKYFAEAVKEICGAFEVLQSGLGDDTDRSALGSEALSVDGVEDSVRDVDLKDGIRKDGTNGETESRGLGGCGSGLERCSRKKHKLPNDSPRRSKGLVLASSPKNTNRPKEETCDVKQENNVIGPDDSKVGTSAEGSESNENDGVCDAKGDGQKNKSSPLVGSVRAKHSVGGNNLLTNGHKSEKMTSGSKRNPKDEGAKNVIQRKSAAGSSGKESSPDLKSDGIAVSRNKAKTMVKDGKYFGLADDGKKDAEGSPEEQAKSKLSGLKKGDQIGPTKRDSVSNEVSHPAKRSKHADMENNGSKGSLLTTRKIDSRSSNVPTRKTENIELKPSTSHLKTENRTASRVQTGSVSSNILSDEESLPPTKRRRRAYEATSDSAIISSGNRTNKVSVAVKDDVLYSDKVKSPVTQLHTKRRAVRLFDEDDEEEARTPIHGGSLSKIHASSGVSDCMKNADVKNEVSALDRSSGRDSGEVEVGHSKECFPSSKLLNESSSPHAEQHGEKRPKKVLAANFSHCLGKPELERVSSKESKKLLISPKKSPWSGATNKTVSETSNISRQSKVAGAGNQKKAQSGSGKAPSMVSDSLIHSQNQVTTQRSMTLSSGERSKSTTENISFLDERMEAVGDDKTSSLIDLRISDPATSIKHLIAAAQAKRRQAHSQHISHGNAGSLSAPSTEMSGGSPSPVASDQPFVSGSSNLLQPDVQGCYPRTSIASPSHGHLVSSNNQPDAEEFEERRVSSGHRPAGGSLSGGTEAAVARDAFEGMIETLSRTKESIGRATRLAIDCAKYGIANEVVELLIRKLESEASFHRKVDLFFLVDSITQCSHSHKGIAGASYIPIVQAALPRLLGAAAPPGAAASENRRQCIKVLRLWLERKILPESLLRRYMDDIGVPNDDASAGFFLRRPSRAERAVDDPIREMEGMLVDEYGSNATFQLPGFLTSHAFEDDDEDDLPSSSYKEATGGSPVESVPATVESETYAVTPNDRRHFVLEDVDGELEMEDVSGHPKDERSLFANGSFESASQGQGSDGILETHQIYSNELDPVHEGSPPLPFDSPPPTPPLPSSPPPPPSPSPPPPPSSSPPPPPPPPLPPLSNDLNPIPLPPSVPQPSLLPQPSLSPQPLVVSQHIHVSQSSTPSSPKLAYQPPQPHEYSSTPSGNKLVQMTVNTPHGGHIDGTVRSEMYANQSSCFVPAVVGNPHEPSVFTSSRPLDFGRHDSYLNSQASQPIQPFQTGNAPLGQRPFHHAPPPQTPSSHYLYPTSTVQQHPYPRPYSLPNLPDGPRRYVADEPWRISTGEFNTDKQRGVWMSGGRPSSSGLGLPFAHEGYFRPPLERLPAKNVGFQPAAPSSLPAGVLIPGHTVSPLLPSRPDMAALNGWRPS